jgi:hypothetical protein
MDEGGTQPTGLSLRLCGGIRLIEGHRKVLDCGKKELDVIACC